jgi:hypothetical protein
MHLDMREKFLRKEQLSQICLRQGVGWLAARQATQVHLSFAEVSQLHIWDVQEAT